MDESTPHGGVDRIEQLRSDRKVVSEPKNNCRAQVARLIGDSMGNKKEVRNEPNKDAVDYRGGDMTEGAAAGKMPGVDTSDCPTAGQMPGGDMTEGAAAGKMPGVETSDYPTAG